MKGFVDYIKEFIENELPSYEGSNVYGCDLGYTITESINADGSATYCRATAKEYIKAWFDEAGEVYEYQKSNYGEAVCNPFEEPEKFHVCMIIEGVNSVLGQCDIVDEFWNEERELDADLIENILEYVRSVDEINF